MSPAAQHHLRRQTDRPRRAQPRQSLATTSVGSTDLDDGETTTVDAVVHDSGDTSTSYTVSVADSDGYSYSLASGTASGDLAGGTTTTVTYDSLLTAAATTTSPSPQTRQRRVALGDGLPLTAVAQHRRSALAIPLPGATTTEQDAPVRVY